MIGRIRGTLAEKQPPEILVDVAGVGYEIHMPMTSFYQLPAVGEEVVVSHILWFVKTPSCCLVLLIKWKEGFSEN